MASDNPYSPPSEPLKDSSAPGRFSPFVVAVARAQRLVNKAVLCYLMLIPANLAISTVPEPRAWMVYSFFLVFILVVVFCAISVFRLAAVLKGNIAAIFYTLAILIPCIGLLVLIVLSSQATSILKRQNIKVGLLGANPKELV